jgi:hypothetical protein
MMRLGFIAAMVASALLGSPGVATAAPAPAEGTQTPAAIPENAVRLSRLLNPEDKLLDVAMRGFQVGIDTTLKKNPDDAALFDQNPGLLNAIVEAGKPIVRKHVVAAIPVQQRRYADFYARKFSVAEIDQLIAFYSTPTGMKVVAAMYDGLDLNKMADTLVTKDGDAKITTDTVGTIAQSAAGRVLPGLDGDDWKALVIFMGTPAYGKLKTVLPELRQLSADVGNEADPAMDAELNKAIEVTVGNYFAARKAKAKP